MNEVDKTRMVWRIEFKRTSAVGFCLAEPILLSQQRKEIMVRCGAEVTQAVLP